MHQVEQKLFDCQSTPLANNAHATPYATRQQKKCFDQWSDVSLEKQTPTCPRDCSHNWRSSASATPRPWSRKKRCKREKPVWSGPVRYRRNPWRRAPVWTSCGDAKPRDKEEDDRNMCPARFQCCCKQDKTVPQPAPPNTVPKLLAICRIAPNCSGHDQDGCVRKRRTHTNRVVHCMRTRWRFWAAGSSVPMAHLTVDVTKALNINRRWSNVACLSVKSLRLEKKATTARRRRL